VRGVLFFKINLLFFSVLFLQRAFSQEYIHWSLPEGAKARLGKGEISEGCVFPRLYPSRGRR
jgi:hypothetical protein